MKRNWKKVRFWILYHFGLILFSLAVAILMKYRQTGVFFPAVTIVPFSTIFLMSALIGYLAIYLVNRSSKLSHTQLRKRIVPAFIFFLVSSVIIANVVISLGVFIWFLVIGRDLSEFLPHLFQYELDFPSFGFLSWLLFFSIAFFYVLWRKSSAKELLLREQILKFQYQRLKSQINPHFLFNSLNTLSELVYEDAKKADSYIQKLSYIYRYVLENEDTEFVTLEKEINFVKDFFNLQKERDGDKIKLTIDISDMEKYKVMPVSLQMLVENALKHNASSKGSPLNISIILEDDHIVVSNNIQQKSILDQSTQTGLENLRERIKLISDKELVIQEDNSKFIVRLPILQEQK
jgi:two-component system, LytTR family, sensor kinase